MAAFSGKYELVRNEGFLEHLIATGLPQDKATKIVEGSKTVEIAASENSVTFTRNNAPTQTFTFNKEITENTPDGKSFKSIASLNGNQIVITSNNGSTDWKKTYTLSGSELTITTSASKAGVSDGNRIYKRV